MVTPGVPPIPHVGGPILPPGGVTVLIGGVPAARMGDMCVCVGPPDVIAKGSTGVFIMGMPAARMGDLTAHGGSIVVGLPTVLIGEVMPGAPPVVVPPILVLAGGGSSSGINSAANQLRDAIKKAPAHAKAKIAQVATLVQAANSGTPFCEVCDKNRKEKEAKEKKEAEEKKMKPPSSIKNDKEHIDKSTYFDSKSFKKHEGILGSVGGKIEFGGAKLKDKAPLIGPLGGSHQLDVFHGKIEWEAGIVHGIGGKAKTEIQMVKQSASLYLGEKNNPFGEVKGEYKILDANAKADLLIGDDGKRIGLALGGKAEASLISGSVKGEINIPIPFTNWSIGVLGKAGKKVGIGAGAGGHFYYDKEQERTHLGAFGSLSALIVGAGLDFDISIGKKYKNSDHIDFY
jgi:uncharacterized Zn-binding protein involved in type VI secretion